MLILKQDHLTIDIERNKSIGFYEDDRGEFQSEGVSVVFNMHVNGGLNRHIFNLEILRQKDYLRLFPNAESLADYEDREVYVKEYDTLIALLRLLEDMGYWLGQRTPERFFCDIITKIDNGMCELFLSE